MYNKTQFLIKPLILLAAMAPVSVSADVIFSDEVYTAFTSATTQLLPAVTDFDSDTVPIDSPASVLALSRSPAGGQPFPNIPTSQTTAFASAAQLTLGGGEALSGVGANGFFLRNSLPPNTLEAAATYSVTITNTSTTATEEPLVVDIFIPTPTLQFFGNIGNSFPAGADPALDASARVQARVLTKVTHPNGSIVEDVLVDYGMVTFRNPQTGVFGALPLSDSVGLTRFDEPDGSFGFQLPELFLEGITSPDLAELGPGDVMEFSYDFFATASTGFGETGIFAAIGDPFNLNAGGGRGIDIKVAGEPGPVVPIPGTVWLLSSGLLGLWGLRKGVKNQA